MSNRIKIVGSYMYTTYGGRWVVNPSGGLISKGHLLRATGLAQCSELTWQLRGTADKRQVEGAHAPPARPSITPPPHEPGARVRVSRGRSC
jgi:hypothetical protein